MNWWYPIPRPTQLEDELVTEDPGLEKLVHGPVLEMSEYCACTDHVPVPVAQKLCMLFWRVNVDLLSM